MDVHKLRKIFQRYCRGRANETESALVEAWYRSYSPEVSYQQNDDEENELRNSIRDNIRSVTLKRKTIHLPLLRVAAGLVLFLTTAFLAWRSLYRQDYLLITAGVSEVKEIQLSDGSKVWLNATSRLKTPEKFNGRYREVILEEGEAFFSIKHDDGHPFIVHTPQINVRVLGTSFDIKAWHKLGIIGISVATGRVSVAGKGKMLAVLEPGRQLNYTIATGLTELKNIDAGQIQSWKDGSTYLQDVSFAELALTIKNIYGLSVKAGDKGIANYRFSLRLIHSLPPAQVLDLICQLHQTHFRKEGNEIVLY